MKTRPFKVLVIDDEDAMREVLELRLRRWGYEVSRAASAQEGWDQIAGFAPDIVICDVVMPEQSGLELVDRATREEVDALFIMITAHGTVDLAVEAMKNGAYDFLTKPLEYPKLLAVLQAAREDLKSRLKMKDLGRKLESGRGLGGFIGDSLEMEQVYGLIRKYAIAEANVLITGESGTGKELAARTIHQISSRSAFPFVAKGTGRPDHPPDQLPRSAFPFVAINAAAIPSELIESELFGHKKGAFTGASESRSGCFEQAHGGILFLDFRQIEIAEMRKDGPGSGPQSELVPGGSPARNR